MANENFQDGQILHGAALDQAFSRASDAQNLYNQVPIGSIPTVTADQFSAATTLTVTDKLLLTQPDQATGPTQLVATTLATLVTFLNTHLTFPSGGGTTTTITVSNPGQQLVGASFVLSGTLSGYTAPPTSLRYSDDSGATWVAAPSPTITTTTFSFTHPAYGSAGNGKLIQVTDPNGITVGTSPAFNVVALGEVITLAANSPIAQGAVIALNGTWANVQPAALDYTTNGGSTWIAVTSLVFGGGSTWTANGPTTTTAGTITISVRDHTNTTIQSNAVNVTVTSTETITLASASPIVQGTVVALTGTWANAQPANLDYSTNGGSTWTGASSLAFGGGNSWSATGPTASTVGTLNIKVRDRVFTTIQSNTVSITVNAPAAGVPSLPTITTPNQTLVFRTYADVLTNQYYTNSSLLTQAAIGDAVLGVKDLSTAHNNFTDTVSGSGPVLFANQINGKNALWYDGTKLTESDSIIFSDSFRTATNVAIFMVYKFYSLPSSSWLFRTGVKASTNDSDILGIRITGSASAMFGGRCGNGTTSNFPLNVYSTSLDPSWGDYTNKTFKLVLRTVTGIGNVQKLNLVVTDGTITRTATPTYTNTSVDGDTDATPWDNFCIGGLMFFNGRFPQAQIALSEMVIITGTQQLSDADTTSLLSYGTTTYGF